MATAKGSGQHVSKARTRAKNVNPDDPRFAKVSRARSRSGDIPIPKAPSHWHPVARSWFNSLGLSGQSELYEASDWATAVAAAEALNMFMKNHNASLFTNFTRISERLGVTVSDRKRSHIELTDADDADEDEEAAQEAVLGWHRTLRAVPDA
jgi:hypothetical protein